MGARPRYAPKGCPEEAVPRATHRVGVEVGHRRGRAGAAGGGRASCAGAALPGIAAEGPGAQPAQLVYLYAALSISALPPIDGLVSRRPPRPWRRTLLLFFLPSGGKGWGNGEAFLFQDTSTAPAQRRTKQQKIRRMARLFPESSL